MAGRIPQQFVDDLVARIDIVELIDERVPLKKTGRNYVARCPFHNEDTPSFTVSPDKQFYYCFGCRAHGSAIGFLMDYANMEFVEAVHELAGRAGVDVPEEARQGPAAASSEPLYRVLESAAAYYAAQLREHPDAQLAVSYLKGRGLSGETAAEFGVGFAPPGWDNLMGRFAASERTTLTRAGLIIEKEGGQQYDRFRDRIMFPIRDRRGRVIGFGGRVLGDDKPKYLNSPDSVVFHKGNELYGLYEAIRTNRRLERLYVVEGYMDVISLAQFGIRNAVATLGTSATANHMQRLFRTTPKVSFCFDGDSAGRQAAWRAVETLLPSLKDAWQASFMFLPDGKDPDSLVREQGQAGFEQQANSARSLSTFLFEHLTAEVDMETVDGRARLVDLARPLLARLPAGAFRALANRRLAELAGMSAGELTTLMRGGGAPAGRTRARPTTTRRESPSLIRRVITLLLHHPGVAATVQNIDRIRPLELAGAPLLLELLELLQSRPKLSTGAILEHFRDREAGRHLAALAGREPPALGEGLQKEFTDAMAKLAELVDEQRLAELLQRSRLGSLSEHEEEELGRLIARPAPPDATEV